MKISKIIMMLLAFFLGMFLGGLALELPVLSDGPISLSTSQVPSVFRSGGIFTKTFYSTTTITFISCSASSTISSDVGKLDLRSQQVLAKPTITVRRTSTIHSTTTVRPKRPTYTTTDFHSTLFSSTRSVTRTLHLTKYTTVPAIPSVVSVVSALSVPSDASGPVGSRPPYYKFDEDEHRKIELRDLACTSGCPIDISSGEYQPPSLMVPISIGMPDKSVGDNKYDVWISSAASTLFNFEVPASYTGTCSFVFLFPYKTQIDPSVDPYTYSGQEQVQYQNGGLNFALLSGVATSNTTYNSTPSIAVDYGKIKILPGERYVVAVFRCPAGKTITIEGSSANKTELNYHQNTAPAPIGLYLVPCV